MVTRARLFWAVLGALPFLLIGLYSILWGSSATGPEERVLKVYSYSSFMSPWGPGPELAERFYERTGVRVQLIDGGDSQALVDRLRFRSPREVVDVVLGLDQLALAGAKRAVKWQRPDTSSVTWAEALPKGSHDQELVPLQWAPLSLVHRGSYKDVHTLPDLLKPQFAGDILLLDPRTSTPGFQFLNWIVNVLGEEEAVAYLKDLKSNIHSVQSSWSTAYTLFRNQSAGAMFTYVTSAVYHWQEEKDRSYQAIQFDEGLPVQVEYVGVPENCNECAAAHEWVRFLLEPRSQELIMQKNYMLPAAAGVTDADFQQSLPGGSFTLTPGAADVRRLLGLWKRAGL